MDLHVKINPANASFSLNGQLIWIAGNSDKTNLQAAHICFKI